MKRSVLGCLVLLGLMACEVDQKTVKTEVAAGLVAGAALNLGAITVIVPDGWQSQPPSSSMRKAQVLLSSQDGDSEDGELAVFYFGTGSAGSIDANLDRWRGQMKGAEGDTKKSSLNGLAVTTLDITGTYVSSGPMMQGGETKPDFRMIASIVESPAGAYYFKLTGPQKTIAHWHVSFTQFTNSAKGS